MANSEDFLMTTGNVDSGSGLIGELGVLSMNLSSVSNGGITVSSNETGVVVDGDGCSYGKIITMDEMVKNGNSSFKDDDGSIEHDKGKVDDEELDDYGFCVDGDGCSYGKIIAMDEMVKNGESSFKDDGGSIGHDKGKANDEKLDVYGFCVGDFVWGKNRSRRWWPGQVFNVSDASDFALKHRQDGCLLVAFSGDGSCSWCLPSQLVPFVEKFEEMSACCSSKSFINAVQRAVDEVGRLVESEMTCNCVALDKRDDLSRPLILNAGVKVGVLAPEVDMSRLTVPGYTPAELLAKVKHLAMAFPIDSILELSVMRSWLSAFYRAKGGYRLSTYSEPVLIEGMEYKGKNVKEVPLLDQDDDRKSSLAVVNSIKSESLSHDKIYRKRKLKSVAKLMVDVGKDVGESSSIRKRKRKNDDGVETSLTRTIGRKRRVEDSPSSESESEGALSGEQHEESKIAYTPRERKKSKYLCPPYTTPSWRIIETKYDKILGGYRMKSLEDLCATAPASEAEGNPKPLPFSISDANISVNDLLSKIQCASIDHLYLRKEGHLDMVWKFASALRSATFSQGPDYKLFQKCRSGCNRKTKSNGSASPCLTLTFSPEFPLPSKQEIMNLFGKFGVLNEKDTNLVLDSRSAQVVYLKDCEAAEATFKSPTYEFVSDLLVMKQKLDTMGTILENYDGELSVDVKSRLKDEMKNLMESVESVSEKVQVMAVK